MHKVSIDTIKSLINYLFVQGVEREQLLRYVNLTEQQLNLPNQLINTCDYEALYQIGEQVLSNKTLGFEFGQAIEPDRWGILGYIANCSPTIRDALIKQRKFQTLVGSFGTPLQEVKSDTIILKWLPAYHCSHHTVEEIITGWATMAKKLNHYFNQPVGVYFTHSCHGDLTLYQEYFGCEIIFEHDFSGLEVEKTILDVPLTKYNSEVYNLLCSHAGKLVNNLADNSPVEIITQFISNQLSAGVPEIEDAAQNLQMSVRTLQRKLAVHQLTFTGLIDNVRQELAKSYLANTDTKAIYISQMLGFSEQSAFQRAFKRWTGKTPKQYRETPE